MNIGHKITWSPRARKNDVREVYLLNAKGLDDEAKVDSLGLALYVRCVDILCVKRAREGGGIRCYACHRAGRETYTISLWLIAF